MAGASLIGDVQAGLPGTRMPDGTVIYATAAAGNAIYRGHRLPPDLSATTSMARPWRGRCGGCGR